MKVRCCLMLCLLLPTSAYGQGPVVKKTNENRCYQEGHPRYKDINVFTPYTSLQSCLNDGGRVPPGVVQDDAGGKQTDSASPSTTPRPTPVL